MHLQMSLNARAKEIQSFGFDSQPCLHPMCKLQAEAWQDRYDLKEEAWTRLKSKSKEGLSKIHAWICKGPGA